MSRPRQRLSRSRGIFLRLPIELVEALESISEDVGLRITDIIKICIAEKLKDLTENEELSTYCRLKVIDALIEDLKKKEEKARRTWKQLARSHPHAYLLRNIDIYSIKDRAKIERIRELIKNKRLICPRCGEKASGIYEKEVKGYRYLYCAHKRNGKIKWCYIGRVERLPNFSKRVWRSAGGGIRTHAALRQRILSPPPLDGWI